MDVTFLFDIHDRVVTSNGELFIIESATKGCNYISYQVKSSRGIFTIIENLLTKSA